MPVVGIGELARHLGRDPKCVRDAVAKGLVTRNKDFLFDLDKAIAEFQANVTHTKGRTGTPSRPGVVSIAPEPEPEPEDLEIPGSGSDYVQSRVAVQLYEARLKKLKYETQAKKLVPADQVESARFTEMKVVRDACFNLPSRIAARLAAERDEARVYELLEDEIRSIFEAYAEGRI